MTTTPKDGDIGSRDGWELRRWSDGAWRFADEETDEMPVIPTGERAIPIDWIERENGIVHALTFVQEQLPERYDEVQAMIDVLRPPTPEPEPEPEPRFREGDVVVCGDHPYFYVVNAEGVPCHADGTTTGAPLESDEWRVIGTINPTEGDGGTNRLQDAAEIVGRAVAAKHRFEADWKAATAVAYGDGQ